MRCSEVECIDITPERGPERERSRERVSERKFQRGGAREREFQRESSRERVPERCAYSAADTKSVAIHQDRCLRNII